MVALLWMGRKKCHADVREKDDEEWREGGREDIIELKKGSKVE